MPIQPAAAKSPIRNTEVALAPTPRWSFVAAAGVPALRSQEWLLTNGLGGFAMGTAAGVPTRRYHALLIGATKPPVGRIAALNSVVDEIAIDGRVTQLSSFEFNARPEPALHPAGVQLLANFECDGDVARWRYRIDGIEVVRELMLFRGINAAGLRYIIQTDSRASASSVRLVVRPLVSLRDFHSLIRRGWADNFGFDAGAHGVTIARGDHTLNIAAQGDHPGEFIAEQHWWYDFFYREDAARGQDCVEDLFSPGFFQCEVALRGKPAALEFIAVLDGSAPGHSIAAELPVRQRVTAPLAAVTVHHSADGKAATAIAVLTRATDAFVVSRDTPTSVGQKQEQERGVSTIAGYPWFSDWGRDTLISLPGLLLATGRIDEARRELETFARARRNGIIPNVFNDQTGEPEFNTVDASLWFIHAACRWLDAGGSRASFEATGGMLDACLDVVQHYRRGTDFNIAMDPIDKLITAGTAATQLTWMDARRDGVTFTPRHGKAVEINALWYSALRSLAFAVGPARGTLAADLNDLAAVVGRSFSTHFWNPGSGCLFDVLTPTDASGWAPDASIRPNQIFAVSLPHSPLSPEHRRAVIHTVKSRLLTPMGVRTLDPADPRYRGRYRGTLFDRDGAYHQGTAWPWLLGPLAEAILRADDFSPAARSEARSVLSPILDSIQPGVQPPRPGTCAGQIAEVYDGDGDAAHPQQAGGCPAQAWSVAEALRVLKLAVD